MLQTALFERKVTTQSRRGKTPHAKSTTAIADGGGAFSQPAPIVHCRKANHHQKSPYEVNATIPKVLLVRNSRMPAMICATPPYAKASGTTTGTASWGRRPALIELSTMVVRPKPANPSGPGLARDLVTMSVVGIAMRLLLVWDFGTRTHLRQRRGECAD